MKTRPALHWALDWKSALFTVILLPVLLSLGFWQLERADEKRAIQAQLTAWQHSEPLVVTNADDAVAHYRPVRLRGHFDPQRYFLLDNRTRQGKVGFEVIGLFQLSGGDWFAVNRGWVAGSPDRSTLPAVNMPQGDMTIDGHAYWPQAGWQLKGAAASPQWPKITQTPMPAELQAMAGESIAPYLVRLAPESPAALVTQWQPMNTMPEKHTGYAVQWFLMAVALLVLFVLRNSNLAAWLRGQPTTPDDSHDA
ncbi:MAG TPA: SURF1 family protein [Pseudomonadales bacterium]